MKLKILLKLKILVAATFIISLGLAEYVQMSGVINKAMGQSLVRLAQSTSSQLPNSQLQAGLDQVVAPSKDTTVVVLANKQGVDPKAIAMKGLQVALKGNSK